MFKKIAVLILCLVSFGLFSVVSAKDEENKKYIIYETPTVKTLSQLYWALMKLDPQNDNHVDNFLMINECDLFRDYSQNEFEWAAIRESARKLVVDRRKGFPTHFELLQPIHMAEYDIDNGLFDVWEPYKIDAVRRFEVLAEDIFSDVCHKPYSHHIEGYPKGLYVELNRPFTLDKISVNPLVAKQYIVNQLSQNKKSGSYAKSKKSLYKSRDAYLVMKMRIFSFQEDVKNREYTLAKVLAILESYEIYGDKDLQLLLFSENFKRKKDRSKVEVEMKKRYQERLKKQMEDRKAAAKAAKEEAKAGAKP